MMGRQRRDQGRLFYEFRLEERIPENHLLRRMNVFLTVALADLHKELEPHYSDIGCPSVDPRVDDPDAHHRRLLLRHPLRTEAVSGSRAALGLPLVLQARPGGQSPASLDVSPRTGWTAFARAILLRHIFERVVWAAMGIASSGCTRAVSQVPVTSSISLPSYRTSRRLRLIRPPPLAACA
jgi:hypothetical protein